MRSPSDAGGQTAGARRPSHDVFLSFSTRDKPMADAVCHGLEAAGIRCWMAPRDVPPGSSWKRSIVEAIRQARVMVLIFSGEANQSAQVQREVDIAFESGHPILPFRIENVEMNDELYYCIAARHWLDALTPPVENHIKRLAQAVLALAGPREIAEDRIAERTLESPPARAHEEEAEARAVVLPPQEKLPVEAPTPPPPALSPNRSGVWSEHRGLIAFGAVLGLTAVMILVAAEMEGDPVEREPRSELGTVPVASATESRPSAPAQVSAPDNSQPVRPAPPRTSSSTPQQSRQTSLSSGGAADSAADSAATPTGTSSRTISGLVTDATTGRPLPNAMVRLIGTDRVATSSADGRYSLAISSPGTYKLQVNYIGFVPSAYQIVLGEQHTTAEVDFPLKQASVQLPEIVVPSAMGSALRARGLRQTGRPIINLSYRDAAPSEIYADSVGAARVTSTHLELQDQAGVVWRNVMPGNALVRMSLRRLDGRGAAGSWLGSTADYHGIQLHEDSITLRRYHGQPRTYNRIAAAPYSHRDAAIDLEILVLGDSLLAWAGDRHLFTAGGIRIPSGSALGILTLCCGQWAFNDIWLEELEAVPPSR